MNKADLVFLYRRDPVVLSIEEIVQEEQEGCIRMSKKMKEFCLKELRGEVPGLQGDSRFGATVTEDLNTSAIVERIAQDQHCKSCQHCSAANAIKLNGSAAEGGEPWWLRRSLEAQDQEEKSQVQVVQEQVAQEQVAQEPEELEGNEEQDSWWRRMSLDSQAWGEAWWRVRDVYTAKKRKQEEQEEQERLEQEEQECLEHEDQDCLEQEQMEL